MKGYGCVFYPTLLCVTLFLALSGKGNWGNKRDEIYVDLFRGRD